MGRLKKDHGGYHTSGLWLKYQSPSIDERPIKAKSKKDTKRWCRGKVGVEHDWHRFQHKRYDWERDEYYDPWVEVRCLECGKTSYKRMAKTGNMPFHAFVYCSEDRGIQVQVRVNGNILPFDTYYPHKWWCPSCRQFHYND